MKHFVVIGLFGLLCLIQLAVPAMMIRGREHTLTHGERFLVKTAPIDPYDAFRGRYVWLSFAETTVPIAPGESFTSKRSVYVTLSVDDEGFAHLEQASSRPPESGPYIRMRVSYTYDDTTVNVAWPMDRFYMEETAAPRAETVYREFNSNDEHDVYVAIRVADGEAVIENLYIDDTPIADYVAANPEPVTTP